MKTSLRHSGFSLAEILMAVGVLAVGLMFIAGTFSAGLAFSTASSERTIAAGAADEAFAKIQVFGLNPAMFTTGIHTSLTGLDPNEHTYPSNNEYFGSKRYFWSAIGKRVMVNGALTNSVLTTVFICRKTNAGNRYYTPSTNPGMEGMVDWDNIIESNWPVPVKIEVELGNRDNELLIQSSRDESFISDGCTIVDDATGNLYRVLERKDKPVDKDIVRLNGNWKNWTVGTIGQSAWVWVVPAAIGGGRDPVISVYQKLIRF